MHFFKRDLLGMHYGLGGGGYPVLKWMSLFSLPGQGWLVSPMLLAIQRKQNGG